MTQSRQNGEVAVVIPLYKSDMTKSEEASLAQCVNILGAYPIKIVKPVSLKLDSLSAKYPSIELLSFEDQYFTNVDSYNKLMTSVSFYERFSAFKFILIYQTDAFVFKDELSDWCKKGYDYIGAPSLHDEKFDCLPLEKREIFARALSENRVVFNGGLSLRKVSALIRYLKIYNRFYPAWLGNEDMLFSQEATRLIPMKLFLRLPEWREALHFSFEKSPAATFELTGNQLPFACHAWERYDPDFWKPFISIES